jgi:predicted dehydrogenase
MQKIRWGIIGCGDVTEVKSGPALQQAENSELVAVMRRDKDKVRDYAKRHHVPRWYTDAEKLIQDPEVDAVYIATPPDSHMLYTLQVARAGKPVYVEKPMARSHAECLTMIDACAKAAVPLFTAYYRRSLPRFLKVKSLLEEGAIGKIRFVRIELYQPPFAWDYQPGSLPWRVMPEIAGGGYFIDLASHTFDILDYYFGPIDRVQGYADNHAGLYPAEDVVSCSFMFKSGIAGNGFWCFTAAQRSDVIEFIGEKGKIIFSTFSQDPVRLLTPDLDKQWKIINPGHIQLPHIQSIVNDLSGIGTCPSNGISAARTSWVLDRILHEWRTKNDISFD